MKIGLYAQSPASAIGGVELCLALVAEAYQHRHEVEIIHSSAALHTEALRNAFHVELDQVGFRKVQPFGPPMMRSPVQRYRRFVELERGLSRDYDVFVAFSHGPPPRCHARRGILHVVFPFQPLASFGRNTVSSSNLLYRVLAAAHSSRALLSYDVKTANSAYTRQWTKRRWRISCDVVHPPAWDAVLPRAKERIVLVIGQFTRNKSQLELVRAFAELRDLHESGWRLLCIGSVGDKRPEQEYFAEVQTASRGIPCEFEANADRTSVRDALARSSIFWLATGYGNDQPQTAEHFGVATIEAMAAGCVPVVVDRGGSRETVQHGINGFLWPTLGSLRDQTRSLAQDEHLRTRMSDAARRRAADFDRQNFIHGLRVVPT